MRGLRRTFGAGRPALPQELRGGQEIPPDPGSGAPRGKGVCQECQFEKTLPWRMRVPHGRERISFPNGAAKRRRNAGLAPLSVEVQRDLARMRAIPDIEELAGLQLHPGLDRLGVEHVPF